MVSPLRLVTRRPGAKPLQIEAREQTVLFQWRELQTKRYPGIDLMIAIPNGAHLAGDQLTRAKQWRRLKAQGARSGVADIFLPVARGPYHGLWIELKAPPGHPSKLSASQEQWQVAMLGESYQAVICYGAEQAIARLRAYYAMGKQKRPAV